MWEIPVTATYAHEPPTSTYGLSFPSASVTTNSPIMPRWWWKKMWQWKSQRPSAAAQRHAINERPIVESNPECERVAGRHIDAVPELAVSPREGRVACRVSEIGCIEKPCRWKGWCAAGRIRDRQLQQAACFLRSASIRCAARWGRGVGREGRIPISR